MSKNLKSLNSGVLKCGASQFKANIPSVNGVTLSPATTNPVNLVIELTKKDAEPIMTKLSAAKVPSYLEEFTEESTPMARIFMAAPEKISFFADAQIDLAKTKRMFVYATELPQWWLQGAVSNSYIEELVFVNTVALGDNVFGGLSDVANNQTVKIMFCKDVVFRDNAFGPMLCNAIVIFNGQVTAHNETTLDFAGDDFFDVIMAPQEDTSKIAASAIKYDVRNLTYHGEWNETTRRWFGNLIYYLNGEPLDPQQ